MIKKENGSTILVYKKIIKGAGYAYRLDLTEKKVTIVCKDGIETKLNWATEKTRIKEVLEEAVIEMGEKIINNRNVMYTARIQKNDFELEKAEKHLEKNEEMLTYIKSYKI